MQLLVEPERAISIKRPSGESNATQTRCHAPMRRARGLQPDACKQKGRVSDLASLSGRVVRDKTHIRVRYRLRFVLLYSALLRTLKEKTKLRESARSLYCLLAPTMPQNNKFPAEISPSCNRSAVSREDPLVTQASAMVGPI